MRICVTGTDGIGKSTFIGDMISKWSNYTSPVYGYHDELDDLRDGNFTKEKQQLIFDSINETLKQYGKSDNVVYDRGPVDCLVYALYGNNRDTDCDDEFIESLMEQVKNSLRMIDLMFFIPITKTSTIDIEANAKEKEADYITSDFIVEIDNIFKSIYNHWDLKNVPYVIYDDKPHVLEIFGSPEERVHIAQMYINPQGDMYGESNILTPQEIDELEQLNKKFGFVTE
jgi:GTPase SAR1 family protein